MKRSLEHSTSCSWVQECMKTTLSKHGMKTPSSSPLTEPWACLGRVEVVCVVSDLDGEPHLSKAVERNIPLVVHAHGDNIETWQACLTRWASSGGIPLVLTHQCDDVYEDAYNVGGFTDGDRAACFLLALGVPVERLSFVGYSTDRVGPWSGATDPDRKLAKLAWMARVLDLIDPNWVQRRR